MKIILYIKLLNKKYMMILNLISFFKEKRIKFQIWKYMIKIKLTIGHLLWQLSNFKLFIKLYDKFYIKIARLYYNYI